MLLTFASAGYQGAALWLIVLGAISSLTVLYRRDSNRAERAEHAAIDDHADGEVDR